MEGVVRANKEIRPNLCEFVGRRQHQLADTRQIAAVEARDVVGQGRRMHRNLGMGVRAEPRRAFHTDGAIAKRRALGGTGHDANVLRHDGWFPALDAPHNIAVSPGIKMGMGLDHAGRVLAEKLLTDGQHLGSQ
jgi:hypothetical protein